VTYARWQEKCLGQANSMTFLWIDSKDVIDSGFQYITTEEIIHPNNTAVAEHRACLNHALQKYGYEYLSV
jgi:hypothetical protein